MGGHPMGGFMVPTNHEDEQLQMLDQFYDQLAVESDLKVEANTPEEQERLWNLVIEVSKG